MASEEGNKQNDVVAVELPAPAGWIKKLIQKKGGTLQRYDVVFISPTGEEIKNKRQLDQYLKPHPGGAASSEFDWGTDDTPRRSARLSEKSKAVEAPVSQSPKKKQKKSNTGKGANQKSNAAGEGETTDQNDAAAEGEAADHKDAAAEETKGSAEVPTEDAKDANDKEAVTKEALPENMNVDDRDKITETEAALKEPLADEAPIDAKTQSSNANVEKSNTVVADTKIESKEASSEVPVAKVDESKEKSSEPGTKNGESKGACGAKKESPDGKLNGVETTTSVDQDNSMEKQVTENPNGKDPMAQEPLTGS